MMVHYAKSLEIYGYNLVVDITWWQLGVLSPNASKLCYKDWRSLLWTDRVMTGPPQDPQDGYQQYPSATKHHLQTKTASK